jgi:hypothetical protein
MKNLLCSGSRLRIPVATPLWGVTSAAYNDSKATARSALATAPEISEMAPNHPTL